jgi:hypothetical protein
MRQERARMMRIASRPVEATEGRPDSRRRVPRRGVKEVAILGFGLGWRVREGEGKEGREWRRRCSGCVSLWVAKWETERERENLERPPERSGPVSASGEPNLSWRAGDPIRRNPADSYLRYLRLTDLVES